MDISEAIYDKEAFTDAHSTQHHDVPLILGTEETLQGYGRIVHDFHQEEVWIEQWPQTGTRPVCPGTGKGGGVAEGDFRFQWQGEFLRADNMAVGDAGIGFITGRLLKDQSFQTSSHVLVRDANYHPDGGQVFYPKTKSPYVMLLAKAGDDITLEDFVAFYLDGSCGFQIAPNVWHQSPYPIEVEAMDFLNKQSAVFACVITDTVREFGKYLKVPLRM